MENTELEPKILKTSNIIIWCAALFPLVNIIFLSFIARHDNSILGKVVTLPPMALCLSDWNLWKKEDIKICNIAWPLLVYPVYIWKRSNALEQPKMPFWIWLSCFVLLLVSVLTPFIGGGQSTLERSACELTTKIIREQLHKPISCKSVGILESEGKNHYAFAELSNNNTIHINITEINGGRIYVEIMDD